MINEAKQEHWEAFLEGLSYGDMWMANRYILGKASDRSKTRIPTLSLHSADLAVVTVVASTNEEKSHMLANMMFPSKTGGLLTSQQ